MLTSLITRWRHCILFSSLCHFICGGDDDEYFMCATFLIIMALLKKFFINRKLTSLRLMLSFIYFYRLKIKQTKKKRKKTGMIYQVL